MKAIEAWSIWTKNLNTSLLNKKNLLGVSTDQVYVLHFAFIQGYAKFKYIWDHRV